MSDCSTKAMMPKERRTCGTCKHVNDVRLGCMFAANDNSYYMRCTKPDARACEHHENDPDSLPRRHERLARVAREMLETMQDWYQLLDAEDAPNYCYLASLERKLEALWVSVDE